MKSLEPENFSVPFHRSLDVAHADSYVINSLEFHALSNLYFWRELWIHQGRAAVCVDHLSGNPTRLLRTEECNHVADVCWRSQASHRCPTTRMPVSNELLHLLGQRV
jgi:hypothetical protein